MAVLQPIAQSVPAFDAREDNTFKFVSNGGNQVIANSLIIRDNNTNKIIYNNKIQSYRFEQTVPSNTLKNGIYYNFYFITYDVMDEQSPISNIIPFRCYSKPTINITNIPVDGLVNSSNFLVNINYNQEQGELMDSAKVQLYDTLGNLIFESKNIHNTNNPPISFQYRLNGLDDNTTYQIKVIANTINRTIIESPIYTITVRYFKPALATLVELENNCENGYVQLKNNFYIVDSEQNPPDLGTNPKYLHDGKLYLTENGTYLQYKEGFVVPDDFTYRLFLESPNIGNITTLKSNNGYIKVNMVEDYPFMSTKKRYCVELECYDKNNMPYFIYSDYVSSKVKLFLWIRRKNNLFEIILEDLNKKRIYWNTPTNTYWNEPTGIYWEE